LIDAPRFIQNRETENRPLFPLQAALSFGLMCRQLMTLKLAVLALCLLGSAAVAQAQPESHFGNPYEHGLRILLFPATFTAGISQSSLGSGLRVDLDLGRVATLHAGGGVGWLPVLGEDSVIPYNLRLGASFNLVDRIQLEPLDGTVRPAAVPAAGGQRRGTDTDLDVPMSQKLGGPPPPMRERDAYEHAKVRVVHALRAGYDHQRAVQQQRGVPELRGEDPRDDPDALNSDTDAVAENRVHALWLGYGWSTHWSLTPAEAGERELGFRRFYIDVLLTLPDLNSVRGVPGSEAPEGSDAPDLPVGIRVGMEGAFAALLRSPEALGFGYALEIGALPGKSGAEGYLLIGLGVAFEISTLAD
jgi:hypothetical protein